MTKRKPKSDCEHYWLYEHALYNGTFGGTLVHRQCARCGFHEIARAGPWKPLPAKEWDVPELREARG